MALLLALGLAMLLVLSAVPAARASPMRHLSNAIKRTGAAARRKAVAASSRQRRTKQEEEDQEFEALEEQEMTTGQGPVGGRRALLHQRRRRKARAMMEQRRAQEEGEGEGQGEGQGETGDAGDAGPVHEGGDDGEPKVDSPPALAEEEPKPSPEPMKIAMDFQILDPRPADLATQGVRPEEATVGPRSIFAGKESLLVAIAAAVGAAVLVAGAVLLRRARQRRAAEAEKAALSPNGVGRKRPKGLGALAAASAAGGDGSGAPLSGRLAGERSGAGKGRIVVREESFRVTGPLGSTRGVGGGGGPSVSVSSPRGEFFNLQDIDLQQSPGRGKGNAFLSGMASPRK